MNGLEFYEHFELLDEDFYEDTVLEYNELQFEQFEDEYEVMLYELI
jgi:hypothetical protein